MNVAEAAQRLGGMSNANVILLINNRKLKGSKKVRKHAGSKTKVWQVPESAVDRYLSTHPPFNKEKSAAGKSGGKKKAAKRASKKAAAAVTKQPSDPNIMRDRIEEWIDRMEETNTLVDRGLTRHDIKDLVNTLLS